MNSLFTKLFLWFWVAMLAIGAALLFTQQYLQPDPGVADAQTLARHAATLESQFAEDGFSGVAGYMRALNRGEDIRVVLVTPRGRIMPRHRVDPETRRHLIGLARESAPTSRVVNNTRIHTHPVQLGDTRTMLVAFVPVRGLRELPLWARAAISLLITALLSALLARHLSRPVRAVREASRRLAAGDLDARVPETSRRGDDISALAHDFNRMAGRLQSLLEARNQLLRDISHELRSPLARLQVAVELGRKHPDEAALDRMQVEVERMDALIGELLALARLDSGHAKVAHEPVDLAALLEDICADARFEAQSMDKQVSLQATPVTVTGDPALLHSIFDNIIRNAVRHSPAGGTVSVAIATGADATTVTVADQGPGVPESQLPHIFDPFVRVSAARERDTGGHGLGLAIARRAVELHGGSLRAENLPDAGLQINAVLPLRTVE
jgi:signal transduction histidine kinase